jgi:hypothetical protein
MQSLCILLVPYINLRFNFMQAKGWTKGLIDLLIQFNAIYLCPLYCICTSLAYQILISDLSWQAQTATLSYQFIFICNSSHVLFLVLKISHTKASGDEDFHVLSLCAQRKP